MKQLEIIRKVKQEIETELSKENLIHDLGNEFFIQCKDFEVYIAKDFSRVTMCIRQTPISEIYPNSTLEMFTVLETLKKYL
jgi:hypothetical protein